MGNFGIVLQERWLFQFKQLTPEQVRRILAAMGAYQSEGVKPNFEEKELQILWTDIKLELDKQSATMSKATQAAKKGINVIK